MPFTFTMPKLSPTMEEGTIAKWHKKEGDFVEAGEVLLEVATDKATVEHNALDEGWLKKILIPEGNSAIVNQPLAIFTADKNESIEGYQPEGVAPKKETKPEQQATQEEKKEKPTMEAASLAQPAFVPEPPLKMTTKLPPSQPHVKASPLAKKLAEEQGLDLSTVKGTGPGGRITSKDVPLAQPAGLVTFGREETPTLDPGTYEEIPLSPMRKTIGRRLQESKSFIPHFYVKQTVEVSSLVNLKEQLKTHGLHATYNDMVIRAAALALRQHPEINTGFNSVSQSVIQFKTIDISVAVSLEGGLITPILRHADYKNLGQISVEIHQLIQKAHAQKLKEHEYKGGSFCISNLGKFGITEFTAVINPPQAAILAVGGIEDTPVVKNGQVVPGKTMVLVLSADHRVIDGAAAAEFLKTLKHLLENPIALIV